MTMGVLSFVGEIRVADFKSSDVVQLEVPFSIGAIQASVERRLELLKLFSTDLHIESAAEIDPDIFDAFRQVRDL